MELGCWVAEAIAGEGYGGGPALRLVDTLSP